MTSVRSFSSFSGISGNAPLSLSEKQDKAREKLSKSPSQQKILKKVSESLINNEEHDKQFGVLGCTTTHVNNIDFRIGGDDAEDANNIRRRPGVLT